MHFIGQFVHLIWEKLSLWRIYNIISISEEANKKLETKKILIFIGITFVALFFVDGQYHRKGIGKKLWEAVLSNTSANLITVHSSLYAAGIYKKLGFYQTRNESFRPWLWQRVFDISNCSEEWKSICCWVGYCNRYIGTKCGKSICFAGEVG